MFLYILYRLYKGTGCSMPLVDVQSPSFQAVYIHYITQNLTVQVQSFLGRVPKL